MKTWIVVAKEGFPREYVCAFMSEGQALRRVRSMNDVVKKDKYEAVGLEMEG